ncbi:methylmalonyl Co-A mutase-associated GTPase MeaB, partial [Candidatus Bathyarchaeota archaeon]
FIRSMATRGSLGGISDATEGAVKVLDAAGFDVVLVETVGAGQLDVAVAGIAHTVLLVLAPGLGDEIQAIKAGIMEIADILVVNKADRPGADKTVMDLMSVLEAGQADPSEWKPPIVKTVALTGEGIEELIEQIERHKQFMARRGLRFSERKVRALLVEALRRTVVSEILPMITRSVKFDAAVRMVMRGELSVEAGAELLLAPLRDALREVG